HDTIERERRVAAALADVELIKAAESVTRVVRECAAESEQLRRLAPGAATALQDAGLFKMLVPAEFGGGEIEISTALRAIEIVSRADGAAGWTVMIAGTTGLMAAYIDRESAG